MKQHEDDCKKSYYGLSSSPPLPLPVRYHLLRRQPVCHGDAPPLDVCSPLTGWRVGGALLAVGQSEGGLQVAQRERPADWTVNVDAAGLGHRLSLAHVEPHELLDRVEAVRLQHILHLGMKKQETLNKTSLFVLFFFSRMHHEHDERSAVAEFLLLRLISVSCQSQSIIPPERVYNYQLDI